MFSKSALVALTVALTGTGFAANASDQLALLLGVEPGVYTTSELAHLSDAREQDQKVIEKSIIRKAEASTRGVSYTQPSNETIIASFAHANNTDAGNSEDVGAFIAHVNGDLNVSPETYAAALAHFAEVGSED